MVLYILFLLVVSLNMITILLCCFNLNWSTFVCKSLISIHRSLNHVEQKVNIRYWTLVPQCAPSPVTAPVIPITLTDIWLKSFEVGWAEADEELRGWFLIRSALLTVDSVEQ